MPAIVGLFVLSEPLLKLMYPKASEGRSFNANIMCCNSVYVFKPHNRKWTSRNPEML